MSEGAAIFGDMWRGLFLGAVGVVVLAGCSASPTRVGATVTGPPVTQTTTVTATVTATVTREVTVTAPPKTVTKTPAAVGPRDVTDEYRRKGAAGGVPADQLDEVVAVWQQGNTAEILTTMRRPMGGWDCTGTPTVLGGVHLRFVTVLYEDRGVFRDCQL